MTLLNGSGVARHFHRIAWLAVLLAMGVIVFGAFVRLSDAGLSCPDWPTCYGRAAWPQAHHEIVNHDATAIRPLEPHKAWREQVHRHLAASLGVTTSGLSQAIRIATLGEIDMNAARFSLSSSCRWRSGSQ